MFFFTESEGTRGGCGLKSTSTRDQRKQNPRDLMLFLTTSPSQGGDSHIKKDRNAHQKFRTEPLRGTKILFCRRALKCFSPLKDTICKKKHTNTSYPVTFSQLDTLKGTTKASAADLLRLNTIRGAKTAFNPPKVMTSTLSFVHGSLPPWAPQFMHVNSLWVYDHTQCSFHPSEEKY